MPRAPAQRQVENTGSITAHIDQVKFEYCIHRGGGNRVFVWSYQITILNHGPFDAYISTGTLDIRTRSGDFKIPKVNAPPREKLTLALGLTLMMAPGTGAPIHLGISFDSSYGEIHNVSVSGSISTPTESYQFESAILETSAKFSIEFETALAKEIDLHDLGENGKLSLDGLRQFGAICASLERELNGDTGSRLIGFDRSAPFSDKDRALLTTFMICSSHDNSNKIRVLDFAPILSHGLSVRVIVIDYDITSERDTSAEDFFGVTAVLEAVHVVVSGYFGNPALLAGKIEEGLLREYQKKSSDALLNEYFDIMGVAPNARDKLVAKFQLETARSTRPRWKGRLERGGELATLSAPGFLKRVHAEDIAPDGTVENEIIRAIDPDLMKAVEVYLSRRRASGMDLGDAEGLRFVLSRPARALSAPRAKSAKPHRRQIPI